NPLVDRHATRYDDCRPLPPVALLPRTSIMLRSSLLLGLVLSAVVHAAPPDRPLPPKDAAKAMTLPPGFKATLFAGEPDIVQPIAFTFDDRGRLWVVECLSYPQWTDKPEGKDRVVILEDTDGDGTFD